MARPWRDVISCQNWDDYVVATAANSSATANKVSKLKAVFQDRFENPLAFLVYIGGKLQTYHGVNKVRLDTLDERIKRLKELSSLASEYLKTFHVDMDKAAVRGDGVGKNKFTGVYNSGSAAEHSVDRNVLSLARRSLRKAAYLKEMKAYYARGGNGFDLGISPQRMLDAVSKPQYKYDELIGLTPGVRMEQLDFAHRGDYEADDDGSISCGGAFMQWTKDVTGSGTVTPFFMWLENHPLCLEDNKSLLETRSVQYARADKCLDTKRRDGSERNMLRLVCLTLSPIACDLNTGKSMPLVSTSEYKAERRKDPRGDKTHGVGIAAFVWTENRELFIANHLAQEFHHSSFVSGRNVRCAGMIMFEGGKVTAINNNSGHYKPRKEHVRSFVMMLKERNLITADAVVEVHMSMKRCWRGKPADFLSKFDILESIPNVLPG